MWERRGEGCTRWVLFMSSGRGGMWGGSESGPWASRHLKVLGKDSPGEGPLMALALCRWQLLLFQHHGHICIGATTELGLLPLLPPCPTDGHNHALEGGSFLSPASQGARASGSQRSSSLTGAQLGAAGRWLHHGRADGSAGVSGH